jgi:hypothetical protein
MKHALILLILLVSACNSSDNKVPPEPGITIPDNPRNTLPTLPDVAFDGSFSTTNPTSGGGSATDSDRIESSTGGTSDGISDGSADGSTDGTTDGSTDGTVTGDLIFVPSPGPETPIDPGTLTSGRYDDHLNPHLYQHYASDYLQRRGQWIDIPRLDFNHRIQVEVKDTSGAALADATIEVRDINGGSTITLSTPANGVTSLYSLLDNLPEIFDLRVTAADGTSQEQQIDRQQAENAGRILATLPTTDTSAEPTQTPVDLMFVVDTTGSMGDELGFLQTELSDIFNSLTLQQNDIRIGFVFYRDQGDIYTVRSHPFSNDYNQIQSTLDQESANGGGDYPEAMDQALWAAVNANWNTDSRKVLFLIADAPPHSDRMRSTWDAAQQARLKNIHIVPVAASGVAEDAEYIMRSTAALTNGRHLFLTDDSGLGRPHNEPDVECYVVTSLRLAMIDTLDSLITGTRVEPSANEIIRQVGNYDNGVCQPADQQPEPQPLQSDVLIDRIAQRSGEFTEQQIKVITDQTSLDTELVRYSEDPLSVDLDTGQIVLIDMGQKNTGGHSIEAPVFTESGDQVEVLVEFVSPGANCAVTTALTNPYMFVYVNTRKELVISQRSVQREC